LNGKLRSFVGNSLNGTTFDGVYLFDSTGATRTGLVLYPSTNFSGFFDQTAAGQNRAFIGSGLNDAFGGTVQTFGTNGAQTGHLP
jgi:hypothetical protein